MTEVLGYSHVSLSVTDLGRSTTWYQSVFGLEIDAQVEGAAFRRTRLRAPKSGLTLTLTAHDDQSGDSFCERRTGMDHVAFRIEGAGVEAMKARFEELGVDHSEVKVSSSGIAMITVRDPDNIQLEVFGERPVGPSPSARGN